MEGLFPLPLFPAGSLASSVVTTVWVGVFVISVFHMRLGWVLSGLVVPGYLVPLLISKPWSAWAIIGESILTYWLVWLYSERLSRVAGLCSFFGRDRFFALVLASVLVRVLADGWLWPAIAGVLEGLGYTGFDFRSNLQSFGLVILALTANQFWKTGLLRGLPPFFITLGVTYFVVRYVLMEFTNFTVSGLAYMYEDVATSILASPKSYIVLLTTAFIASRMNLVYGWDFAGILLPSLLALQWYQPGKILSTFAEAFVIVIVASALLRTRWFANTTMEGARKILFFFNIGFAWKLLLGYLVPLVWPEVKVTDTFAFGYVLGTLLAVKMHDKEILARLTRATLQTSVVAVIVASAVGFGLSLLPRFELRLGEPETELRAQVLAEPRELLDRVRGDKVLFYGARGVEASLPSARDLDRFAVALELLGDPAALTDPARPREAAQLLEELNYEVLRVQDRYFYLRERAPVRGWGLYVINPGARTRLVVQCATSAEERGIAESATAVFQTLDAFGLALAGTGRFGATESIGDVLLSPQTLFHAFHRAYASRNVLQVRRYTATLVRQIAGQRRDPGVIDPPEPPSSLWVKQTLPPGLDLASLREMVGALDVRFEEPPYANRQRDETRYGFAELMLDRGSVRKVLARSLLASRDIVRRETTERRIIGYLSEWLFAHQNRPAPRGTELYVPPTQQDLLFFDEEILTPLLRLAAQEYRDGTWSETGLTDLRYVSRLAAVYGYEITLYRHIGTGHSYLIMGEIDSPSQRFWGIYVLRLGEARDYIIEVPRPVYELGAFEYGVSLFERLRGRALLVAGSHPNANLDGSADVLIPDNMLSLFNLFNQVLVREARGEPRLIVQSRAYGYRTGVGMPETDVVLALNDTIPVGDVPPSPLVEGLVQAITRDGLSYALAGSSPETAGYEVGFVAQARYLQASSGAEFAALRLSPRTRFAFRQQTFNRLQEVQFEALDIETVQQDVRAIVSNTERFLPAERAPAGLLQAIALYQKRPDIVTLRRIQLTWPEWRLLRVIDRDSLAAFLLVRDAGGALLGVFNLEPRQPIESTTLTPGEDAVPALDRFLFGSFGSLLFRPQAG